MPHIKNHGISLIELVIAVVLSSVGVFLAAKGLGFFNRNLQTTQALVDLERVRFTVRTGFDCQATFPTPAGPCVAGQVAVMRTDGRVLIANGGTDLLPGIRVRAICIPPRDISFSFTRAAVPAATDWQPLFIVPSRCGINP